MLRLGADVVRDVALAARREWLLTDGLGGWAASTVLGLNTRGGHGLLVVASAPPRTRRRSRAIRARGSVAAGIPPAQATKAATVPGRSSRRKRPGLKRSSRAAAPRSASRA